MRDILPLIQIFISVVLMVLILLQQRGQALGSAFGQGGGFYPPRRGIQQKILVATVVFGALFIVLAILNFIL